MFKTYNQNQIQLLPADLNASVPQDHLARLISQVIDELDTKSIEQTYSAQGQHAFHPKMLIKVIIHGYSIGIRSSRKLADRLNEDLVFMWLSGRQTPDFRTIADFRKDKLSDVKALFVQVLSLCKGLGMVRVGKVHLLKPMIKEVKDNTGQNPKAAITDCGYGTKANWRFLKKEKIASFVPYNNIKQELSLRRQGIKSPPPKRIDKELAKYKLLQKLRYLSDEGRKMMDRRKHDVEPTFGNLKRNLSFRHFHLKGKPKVLMELGIVSLAHNLKKLKNHLSNTLQTSLSGARLGQLPC